MNLQNPLARARGLGSAKSGVHHWYVQRASAVLLLALMVWFIYSVFSLAGADFTEAQAFLSSPLNAAIAIVFLITLLYHAMLGLQVVIEDYVHHPVLEILFYFLSRAGALIGMAIGSVFLLKLALGA